MCSIHRRNVRRDANTDGQWRAEESTAVGWQYVQRLQSVPGQYAGTTIHLQSVHQAWQSAGRCELQRLGVIDHYGGTAAAAPPPFRPSDSALCGNHPLVTPYYCRLGDLLCFVFIVWLLCVWFVCVLYLPSVLWYCWLGLLTRKNRLPYNLYCVGGDVKHCSIQSIIIDHYTNENCVWLNWISFHHTDNFTTSKPTWKHKLC